jgi:hypothetical protein
MSWPSKTLSTVAKPYHTVYVPITTTTTVNMKTVKEEGERKLKLTALSDDRWRN